MKIIEIIPNLATGGGEKFVVDLSNSFADKGHDCTILTLYDPSAEDLLRQYINSTVHTDSLKKRPRADFLCMFRVAKYIAYARPNVVHVHLAAIKYVILAAICFRKIKFFATLHSEAKREAGYGISKWIRILLFKLGLVKPITISEESEKSFEAFYGFSTTTIPNGSSSYFPNAELTKKYAKYRDGVDFLFLHAGRIHKVKNQLMLVEAFERILRQGMNVRLLIAGRIDEGPVFEQLKPHFSEKIVYIGEHADIRAIMSISDAFCLSSTMEGMPISIIEAMSVGCVPICTPVGGCINMIENSVNGFISVDTQIESYESKIKEYCNLDKMNLLKIRKKCIEEFELKYSITNTAELYLSLFDNE